MSVGKVFGLTVLALGVVLGPTGPGVAAEPHGHAAVELKLNNGNKWHTDDALRRGMAEIRNAIAGSLTPIHNNTFSPASYDALAARVQTQIDYVVANCKLSEEADQQLHLVLEQMLDGINEMKASGPRQQGAIKIVRALDAYGKHFNHAGWQPLGH
jgi:hypothetical protein